ncbi:MAG: site-specific integrase [Alphaproteobacteria bacterium]|nr:site-specific integrase [Alphaproteobacteria bacterium]
MLGKITKREVDALSTNGGKEQILWDSTLKGFGVRVREGGIKTYIIKYRMGNGRSFPAYKFTIGKHGSPWTPDSARREAERLLALINQGTDPAKERNTEKQSMTVAALCELYVAEGCAHKKPSTLVSDRGRISRHIIPLLGQRRAKDITRTDVQKFLRDVAEGKTACTERTKPRGLAHVKGGKGTATRTTGMLGGIFTFAIERGICETNPVHGVKRYKDNKNERFLSTTEVAALGEAITVMEKEGDLTILQATAIRLLLFTGCRKSEILTLKWPYIDFERGYIRLPDSKTGQKAVAIGAPALELLSKLPRLSEWVFPAASGTGHMVGLPRKWLAVRQRAGLEGVRLHDLRHSFASFGAAAGDSLLVIGKLLGHADSKTTSRYAHLADDPLQSAANRIAGSIAAAMQGNKGAEVIPLHRRGS